MRVKMLVGLSGPTINLIPGDEHDFPRDEALRFIAAGFAVPAADQAVETATLDPLAIETRPKARKKKA